MLAESDFSAIVQVVEQGTACECVRRSNDLFKIPLFVVTAVGNEIERHGEYRSRVARDRVHEISKGRVDSWIPSVRRKELHGMERGLDSIAEQARSPFVSECAPLLLGRENSGDSEVVLIARVSSGVQIQFACHRLLQVGICYAQILVHILA